MNMRTSISTTASAQWQCTGADTLHSPGDARHSCATTFDNFWHTERCLDAHKTPHSTHVRIYTAIVFCVMFGVQELIHYVIKFNTSSKRSEGTSHAERRIVLCIRPKVCFVLHAANVFARL